MKFISTLLLGFVIFSADAQNWKITSAYSLGAPRKEMGNNIPLVHSAQAGFLYRMPGVFNRLSAGIELGLGIYASKRIEQTFQFNNNVTAVLPVSYNSNVFNGAMQLRYDLAGQKSLVVPYVQAKGGLYNFFSNIFIDDPHDPDGCRALQQENIINDKTLYWSAGTGLQVDPSIFTKRKYRGRVMIDLSVNMVKGGELSYINTKRLMSAQDVSTNGGKPLSVQFINASTQEIHEHTVAQVYTSALRLLEFRAGVTVNLGDD
ncbi:MAG: hypothetical protein H7Y42_07585 [Chitinophagaceae bacterium]|nr:hypothetical protein [Chitinophagaceae bacterium]